MKINEIVAICEQKKQTGDYQTLAKILKTTVDSARMRYYRKDKTTVLRLYEIIRQREDLVNRLTGDSNE